MVKYSNAKSEKNKFLVETRSELKPMRYREHMQQSTGLGLTM